MGEVGGALGYVSVPNGGLTILNGVGRIIPFGGPCIFTGVGT